ncbi:protein disulfide-isomerase A2 [Bombina bombina]|uniref:protein disulfide-isomerase A2 n=1 Tax=Bombina bombina TaxID=8345 RepID=UPI00235AC764|nr:protein disulfide-isomerase A2 [Bombina bombina]
MRWLHLLLFCLTVLNTRAEEQDLNKNAASAEISDTTSEEKAADSDEILEEENILVLNEKNFDKALSTYKFLLVEFYAPWCGHCQALAPDYAKAAEILKNQTSEVRLAKVDSTVETNLSTEFGVNGYPTLKFFKDGNRTGHIDYGGRRETDGFVKWLLRRVGPLAVVIDTVSSAEEFISAHEFSVIGFFKDSTDADIKIFYNVADISEDFNFALTHNEEVFRKFGVTEDAVIFFKSDDEKYEHKPDEDIGLDKDELRRFLVVNSLDLLTEYSAETSEKIFAAKIPNHLLLFVNKTDEPQLQLIENFRKAAPEFKGKVLFVYIDSHGEHAEILQYFGLNTTDVPTIRFINIESVKKFSFSDKEITTETVKAFCQGVLDGKIKQNLMSEEIPEDWDKNPVKVLVGKNFEEVAFDETKNVFVEFYAPWCTHCQELAPIWEELGEKYKDHENVIIAKIDATANEIDGLRVRGFPNLRLFPAGTERKMIEYTRDRTVELFSAFIDSGGVLPEEEKKDSQSDDQQESTKEPDSNESLEKDEL